MSHALSYRPFRDGDLMGAYRLSSSLGWPHRIDDWRFAVATGHVFVAEQFGEIVGTAVHWRFGSEGASIGMVMSRPRLHEYEVERHLVARVIDVTRGKSVVLNSPLAKVRDYERLHFAHLGTVQQFQGATHYVPEIFPEVGTRLRPLSTGDAGSLIELASRASGLDRSALMPSLLRRSKGIGLDRNGVLVGFALFRRFGRGFAVGPVITSTPNDISSAICLISYLLRRNTGSLVRIDLPEGIELAEHVRKFGLQHVDTVFAMARNSTPRADARVSQVAVISHSLC